MVVELARDLVRTQDQLGPRDTENLVFKLFNDRMPKVYGTMKIESTNIGHAFILGHAVNGRLGVFNGIDGSQITLGAGGLGATTITRVLNLENLFVEPLRDSSYIDVSETTATVDTTNFLVVF